MRITFYQRRPQDGNFSIERLFADVRRALPTGIETKVVVSRFPSRGLWGRVYNMIEAALRQGEVNHVTGDVHYLALLLCKRKTLLTIPDLVSVHRLKGIRREFFRFFWYWLPVKRAAVVAVISQFTKEELFRHVNVDRQKVRVVHACVSEDFHPAPREFVSTRPVILQVGTGPNKNLERVAEALAEIPCHLRIIGSPNAKQTAVLRENRVEYSFAANIPDKDVIEEYRRCDMVVFASTYEGFGLPIVEAQATGRPVVTSDICSMPEVAGGAACLVDPFDVASIRGGIRKTIHDRSYRDELVRRGFENVERFRSGKIAREYIRIYRELHAR
jgi:glycosyltransferase involved in cell wall biosynthesis